MFSLSTSLQHALRSLRNSWRLSLTAWLLLTLGLATVLFVLILLNGLYFKPLPFPQANRMFVIGHMLPDYEQPDAIVWEDFNSLQEYARAQQLEFQFGAYSYSSTMVIASERQNERELSSERFEGVWVTRDLLTMLQVPPLLGRYFDAQQEAVNGSEVAIAISAEVWRVRYQSDPNIIGRPIKFNGKAGVVAAVMPDKFDFPRRISIWALDHFRPELAREDQRTMQAVALGNARDLPALEALLPSLQKLRVQREPEMDTQARLKMVPFPRYFQERGTLLALQAMFTATMLVLLVVCINVSNLFMADYLRRQTQLAIRATLGAHRGRLIAEFFAHALCVTVLAALSAIPLATTGVSLILASFAALGESGPPAWMNFSLDARLSLALAIITLLTAIAASAIPAWKLSSPSLIELRNNRTQIGSSTKIAKALLIAQISAAAVLLMGTAALGAVVNRFASFDYGVNTQNIVSARIYLDEQKYPEHADRLAFFAALNERLASNAAVQASGLSSVMPGWSGEGTQIRTAFSEQAVEVASGVVDANFAATFQPVFLAGRGFTTNETSQPISRDQTVPVIVDERFAREVLKLPDRVDAAIGQAVQLDPNDVPRSAAIVGVVRTLTLDDADDREQPTLLVPSSYQTAPYNFIVVKLRPGVGHFKTDLQRIAAELDADTPLYWLNTYGETLHSANFEATILLRIYSVLTGLTLLLTAIGLYGLVSQLISQKVREIALKRALGASNQRVLSDVGRVHIWQIGIGLLLGVMIGKPFANLMLMTSWENTQLAWWTGPSALSGLALICVFATLIPALRALTIQPQQALKEF